MKSKAKRDQREPEVLAAANSVKPDMAEKVRSFVAEWTVTIILLLFGTTTLLQAFVVPTGSMGRQRTDRRPHVRPISSPIRPPVR